MNAKRQPGNGPGIERSKNVEDLHHLRLMALLDELVQARGIVRAARELGVNYRTPAAARKSGRLSGRMRGALDQRLMEGGGSPAREQRQRNDELAGRLEQVEGKVESVGTEASRGLASVQGEVLALRNDYTRDLQRVESRQVKAAGEDGAVGAPSPSLTGNGSAGRAASRRDFPELATLEPAPDDESVFGDAWPLIQEWRQLRDTHPNKGKGLEWLRDEERLMSVELALLDDHGLTLPRQTYPLRGLDRGAQTNWRRKTLEDARRKLTKQEMLHRLLRMLTGGRWGR